MMSSEWIKIRRSVIWLILFVSPLIAALFGLFAFRKSEEFPWLEVLSVLSVLHAMLFLPLLSGVYASLVCRYEHAGGGWKSMLASPVSRTQVYVVKFLLVMFLLAVTQLLLFAAILAVGLAHGLSDPIPWREMASSFAGGWIACLPLVALQLFASVAMQSFAAPLAINTVLTLPNILVANSARFSPYDPWTQPMLAMIPHGPHYDYAPFHPLPVLGGFVLFFIAGWTYFAKKAV